MRRVMMMSTLKSVVPASVFFAACTSAAPAGGTEYDSVLDRLADGATRMHVGGAVSSGTVTARRWTPTGWIAGDTPLVIENGELSATVDDSGRLTLATFDVGVAPIEIPEEVFRKPAQLSDVRVRLTAPTSGSVTWTSDDEATAKLTLALELDWAISVSSGKTPLGSQDLPPIDVDVTLGGDGQTVEATIGLAATGELWNWAGLLELIYLELQLSATTVD